MDFLFIQVIKSETTKMRRRKHHRGTRTRLLSSSSNLAFLIPRTFFILFFLPFFCFLEVLAAASITPCLLNLNLGSNFFWLDPLSHRSERILKSYRHRS